MTSHRIFMKSYSHSLTLFLVIGLHTVFYSIILSFSSLTLFSLYSHFLPHPSLFQTKKREMYKRGQKQKKIKKCYLLQRKSEGWAFL